MNTRLKQLQNYRCVDLLTKIINRLMLIKQLDVES